MHAKKPAEIDPALPDAERDSVWGVIAQHWIRCMLVEG
jgi:hypothetical protein